MFQLPLVPAEGSLASPKPCVSPSSSPTTTKSSSPVSSRRTTQSSATTFSQDRTPPPARYRRKTPPAISVDELSSLTISRPSAVLPANGTDNGAIALQDAVLVDELITVPLNRGGNQQERRLLTKRLLAEIAPVLVKWRFLSFYSGFVPSLVRAKVRHEVEACAVALSNKTDGIDWTGIWSKYKAEERASRFSSASIFQRATSSVCSMFRSMSSEDRPVRSVIESAAEENGLPVSQLMLAIEAYAAGVSHQPPTAVSMIETKDYCRLAGIILDDIEFLTSHRFSTPSGINDVLHIALHRCRSRYFEVLEYACRGCLCGCESGMPDNLSCKSKNRRVRYALNKREMADLDGTRTLLANLRNTETTSGMPIGATPGNHIRRATLG